MTHTGYQRQGGALVCDGVPLSDIAAAEGTPLYIYSAGVIAERYRAIADAIDEQVQELDVLGEDFLIAAVDGLKGFPEAIAAVYPRTQVQLCIVHMVRNSLRYVSWKHARRSLRTCGRSTPPPRPRLLSRSSTPSPGRPSGARPRQHRPCHAPLPMQFEASSLRLSGPAIEKRRARRSWRATTAFFHEYLEA